MDRKKLTSEPLLPPAGTVVKPAATIGSYLLALWLGTHIREDQLPFSLHYEIPLHFSAYFVLTLLTFRLFNAWRPLGQSGEAPQRVAVAAVRILLVFILALLDEVSQPLTGRSFQAKDLIADSAGIAVGFVVESIRARWSRRMS